MRRIAIGNPIAMLPIQFLRRSGWVLALLLVASGTVAASHLRNGFDVEAATGFLARHPAAPLVFLAVHIAASLVFVPRTLLAVIAGLAFGLWWGLLWSALGGVLGATAGFLLARYINTGLIDPSEWRRFGPILARVERGGWRMVALICLVPLIPHSLSNYALGLTRLRLAPYAFGSLVGQLPLTVAYVELSAAGGRAVVGGTDWLLPSAVGITALALSMLVPAVTRWLGVGSSPDPGPASQA